MRKRRPTRSVLENWKRPPPDRLPEMRMKKGRIKDAALSRFNPT